MPLYIVPVLLAGAYTVPALWRQSALLYLRGSPGCFVWPEAALYVIEVIFTRPLFPFSGQKGVEGVSICSAFPDVPSPFQFYSRAERARPSQALQNVLAVLQLRLQLSPW